MLLLVGEHALARYAPELADLAKDPEVWVDQSALTRSQGLRASWRQDAPGSHHGTLHFGAWVARARLISEGDARLAFLHVNRDQPTFGEVHAVDIHVASPASLAYILRASLYEQENWHPRVIAYHSVMARFGNPVGSETERLAFRSLRAQRLAKLDAQPVNWTMRVSNEAFFSDFKYPWLRVHGHDELHQTTCYGDVPLYVGLKDDPDLAYVPFHGFQRLAHADRVRLVREECYALALERVLIPAQDLGVTCEEGYAFQHALRRLCTSLARGWFRDYAIDHYPEISRYDRPFAQCYRDAVERGDLHRHDPDMSAAERRGHLMCYWRDMMHKDRMAGLFA